MKKEQNSTNKTSVEKKPFFTKELIKESLIAFAFIFLFALLGVLLYAVQIISTKRFNPVEITYSQGKTILFSGSFALAGFVISLFLTVFFFLSLIFAKPSGTPPNIGKKGKNLIFLGVLSLFGILAYLVISIFLTTLEVSNSMSLFIAGVLTFTYDYLIYKLYLEEKTFSNALFWEIFRFAIVGLIAAVFDFLLCFLFQFYVFQGNTAWYVSGISTAMGFTVGVIINYLMSTYMVYKNAKSDTSKTIKGMAMFLILAIIGLLIGIAIQYVLYDLFNLKLGITLFSYPICFVLRTLIVMVYNYISRKIFIYR